MAVSEYDLQVGVVQWLKRNKFMFAADQSGLFTSKRSAGKAKLSGLVSGEPDLRIYLEGGRCLFIEMKAWKGRLSDNQTERIERLRFLGFQVEIVKERTPADAVERVKEILLDVQSI